MTRYLSLGEYFWLAEQVTGIDADSLSGAARIELADSALHAPQAGYGGHEFYPDLLDKAAVLVCRLAWNHPLPDGNKRAAWGCLALFLDLNDVLWDPDPPRVDDAEAAMLATRTARHPRSRFVGSADHLVSNAFYFTDPEVTASSCTGTAPATPGPARTGGCGWTPCRWTRTPS